MTKEEAWAFARDWIEAWNKHHLDRILSHYEDSVELTSPAAARLRGSSVPLTAKSSEKKI